MIMDNMPNPGTVVTLPNDLGTGVVSDRDNEYREALVRMDCGTEFDTSHGQWWSVDTMEPTGDYRPDALVWFGSRMVPASEHPMNKYAPRS
jgi:hypothetical protein